MIKVLWGRDWDPLLAADAAGALVNKMNTTPDGQFQTYLVEDGAYIRNNFFSDPRLQRMVANMSDEEIKVLSRGGHDYRKVYAAFKAASEHVGQPTVILAQTVKGWTIDALEGKNATHQMKKLTTKDLKAFRDRLYLEITDDQLEDPYNPPYYHPGNDSEEIKYLQERRRALGGYMPERRVKPTIIKLPGDEVYSALMEPAGEKTKVATTQAFVRLLRDLMRDKEIGHRIVPIAPDEFRTFGMDSMFPTAKIYNPHGQTYESVDRKLLLSYKESEKGQLLHEGISEAGAMGSTIAAGSAYAMHGEPMIPFYIFYSMFGFQRTGDSIWAMADQLARGFLIGATAGRTTLTGEGLQHADGHSPLLASTNPAVVHYDPAFAYEVGHIIKDGLRRMYGHEDQDHPDGENVIFYVTVYNEPVSQPGAPENLDVDALLQGMYHYAAPTAGGRPAAGPDPGLRGGDDGGPQGAADAGRRVGGRRRHLVGDLVERVAPGGRRARAVEPDPPDRGAALAARHPGAARRTGPGDRGQRLHAGGAGPDRARGCSTPGARWAPTGSASPTPGPPPVATSWSTPSRSSSPPCRPWPGTARTTRAAAGQAFEQYQLDDPTAVAGVAQEGAGA